MPSPPISLERLCGNPHSRLRLNPDFDEGGMRGKPVANSNKVRWIRPASGTSHGTREAFASQAQYPTSTSPRPSPPAVAWTDQSNTLASDQ